ncbi:FAD-dependent oxidoreductase [Aspergillus homomorphus CBS 101889]|uniref:FAD binding domain protein n=1 Tax=Aspergillus homomorphus (strain CBS 101889) TaxID=1450537 RepID=A0A395I7Q6_ASPHC|nr:FAD binding domain protein [Aspergillus homomorphus CBS 101889]RAL15283.1 FAD binding domain protein [Aspergillus homomorphus CBS 101889]
MRVIIVGGGLAGLTLASALEKANIDFVLLEARGRFDPQVGASIGLNAAAMRILDQLGAAKEIMNHTAPIKMSKVHRSDGTLVMPPAFTFPILKARFGYGACFLDRQRALQALIGSIALKDNMLPNKAVLRIDQSDSGVSVYCEDGSSYHGDVVVGCDGVNSKASTRSEMCRLAKEDPDHFRALKEPRMSAEFNCLFGISDPVDGLIEGTVDTVFDHGRSMLVITGKDGRVFWFYHEKLDKVYYTDAKDFPRYSQADVDSLALKNAWRPITETVTLGDLWKKRVTCTLVPLEEALFRMWSWGRIATVGDNSHKMTPNTGQAGNNAIESAAALANQLQRIHDEGLITSQTIKSAFRKWQEKRQARVNATVKEAAMVCRLQALDSRMAPFVMNYVVPNATESLLSLVTSTLIGAEIIEYLPVPAQSFEGSCPFNPSQGIGKRESLLKRTALALPLLVLSSWVATMMPIDSVDSSIGQFLQPRQLTGFGERAQLLQNLRPLAEESVIYAIWLIESNRRANVMTFAHFPTIFWLLGLRFGPGVVTPCYYALHFVFSGIEKFAAADARLTNVAYTRLILPSVVLFMGAPAFLTLSGYSIKVDTAWWHWRWMLQPQILIAIMQWIMVKTRMSKASMHEDTMSNQLRDLPYIRWCLCVLSAVSAANYIATRQSLILDAFSPAFLRGAGGDLSEFSRHGTLLLASLFWVGLLIHDIKSAGMAKESWAKILTIGFVSGALAGPAISVALGWIWREEILASRREKHAVTRDKYSGKSILDVQKEMLLPKGKAAK